MRGKSNAEIAAMIRSRMPKDVLAQQKKVAAADALAFIAPIHFCSFPSILKGWIDRVFTLDFAFGLTSDGWRGDINGRIPLLHHRRALIMSSTIFNEHAYDDGIRDAITQSHRRLGLSLPRHRTRRARLLLRGDRRTTGDHSSDTSTRPTNSARHSTRPQPSPPRRRSRTAHNRRSGRPAPAIT